MEESFPDFTMAIKEMLPSLDNPWNACVLGLGRSRQWRAPELRELLFHDVQETYENLERAVTQEKKVGTAHEVKYQQLITCPFAKRNANSQSGIRNKYRGCFSFFTADILGLENHLLRVHARPKYYCKRCFDPFSTQKDLSAHTEKVPLCPLRENPFEEKLSDEQLQLIRTCPKGEDATSWWLEIFTICFPGHPTPLPDPLVPFHALKTTRYSSVRSAEESIVTPSLYSGTTLSDAGCATMDTCRDILPSVAELSPDRCTAIDVGISDDQSLSLSGYDGKAESAEYLLQGIGHHHFLNDDQGPEHEGIYFDFPLVTLKQSLMDAETALLQSISSIWSILAVHGVVEHANDLSGLRRSTDEERRPKHALSDAESAFPEITDHHLLRSCPTSFHTGRGNGSRQGNSGDFHRSRGGPSNGSRHGNGGRSGSGRGNGNSGGDRGKRSDGRGGADRPVDDSETGGQLFPCLEYRSFPQDNPECATWNSRTIHGVIVRLHLSFFRTSANALQTASLACASRTPIARFGHVTCADIGCHKVGNRPKERGSPPSGQISSFMLNPQSKT